VTPRLFTLAACWLALILTAATGHAAEKKVRLFILSGQSNMAKLDETTTFIPAINKAFPDDDNVFIKVAKGGTPIREWVKDDGSPAPFFIKIQEKASQALKGKPAPESVSLIWMQGEADAKGTGDTYKKNLEALLDLLQAEFKRKDITFVLGRINDFKKRAIRKDWDTVREAQVSFAEARLLTAWVTWTGSPAGACTTPGRPMTRWANALRTRPLR